MLHQRVSEMVPFFLTNFRWNNQNRNG